MSSATSNITSYPSGRLNKSTNFKTMFDTTLLPYNQIYMSTMLNEGAILTYLKRKGVVSPNKPTTYNPSLRDIKE